MKTFEEYFTENYPEYLRTTGTKFYNWNKLLYDFCSSNVFADLSNYTIAKMLKLPIAVIDSSANNYWQFCNLYADLYGIPQTIDMYVLNATKDGLTEAKQSFALSPHHRLRLTAFKLMSLYTDGSAGSINQMFLTVFEYAKIKVAMKTSLSQPATAMLLLAISSDDEFDIVDKTLYYNKLYSIELLGISVDVQVVSYDNALIYDTIDDMYDGTTSANTVYYDGGKKL